MLGAFIVLGQGSELSSTKLGWQETLFVTTSCLVCTVVVIGGLCNVAVVVLFPGQQVPAITGNGVDIGGLDCLTGKFFDSGP